ncbi:MAG: glutathione S-transferase family protein [Nannocystaceae bacterium]|nr:glutathione S-transferase family protein [Nannocystaceae bacterium]
MKLYWGSGSPYAWRAMLALIVKGVEFEDQCLQFDKREHKSQAFLKINPRGRVPALVDGDLIVYESHAIIGYIDKKFPETPLFGKTPAETARILRIISEHDSYAYPAGTAVLRPIFQGKTLEKNEETTEAVKTLHAEFKSIRDAFAGEQWLGGSTVSAADLTVYPTLMLIDRIVSKPDVAALGLGLAPFEDDTMRRWKGRIEALPGVERAYPPHWRA